MAFTQIEILANYIMAEIPGEPSASEGAGDTAIRLLKQLKADLAKLEQDGKRLDWLDEQISWDKEPGIWWHFEWPPGNKLTLRQAIDKAKAGGE